MKRLNMKKMLYILLPALVLVACNKQIDQIRPLTKIAKEGQLASLSGIVETTVGNYLLFNPISFGTYDMPLQDLGESRGNNVTLQSWSPVNQKTDAFFYRNSNGESSGYSSAFYRGSYQIIVSANTTLEGIASFESSRLSTLTTEEQARLKYAKGENLFLRAFTYFSLVRIYGKPYYQNPETSVSVPLKLTSDIKDSPAPVKVVYASIIKDLQDAAQLMKAPVTVTNTFASTAAAWALLSRVYLYMGGTVASPDATANQQAVLYADSVINNTANRFALLNGQDYVNMFADDELGTLGRSIYKNNKEIIFAFDNATKTSTIGVMYHFDRNYNIGATFLPSSDLKGLYVSADLRSRFFKLNVSSGFVETTKWLVLNSGSYTSAPNIYLRMGEVYLNRAEAYAKLSNSAMAKADLKIIHMRVGLPGTDIDNLSPENVMTAILKERRMELAFEGHNSFDYFRNGLPMTRTTADNNGTAMTVQPTDTRVVFTIPNH